MGNRTKTLVAAVITAAAVVTGCGGSSSSTSTSASSSSAANSQEGSTASTTPASDKATFIKEASAACARENGEALQELTDYSEARSKEHLPQSVVSTKTYKAVMLPNVEAGISAVREFKPPPADKAKIERWLALEETAVREVRALKQIKSFQQFEKYFADAGKKLRQYGFTACIYG